MTGALSHIRVLDLSRILAGPWATQNLADFGAEVIKIERPGRGDDTRGWGPPWLKDENGKDTKESAYYLAANRNKKSVAIDMTTPEGQSQIRELAKDADVVVENFKVGGLKKYGLDYESLCGIKPDLVYCSITGFGQDGPYATRAGYDFLIQGMGGLMSLTGEPDEVEGGGPVKAGVAIADVMSGLYATIGILTALQHRDRTGEGQHIDVSLLDVQVATLANQAMNYLTSGKAPERLGNAHPNIVPYQAFQVADGHLILAVGNDSQFARFCEIAGVPELARDERFETNAGRVVNRSVLVPMLVDIFKTKPRDEWLSLFEAEGVPAGPINTLAQVFDDPQVQSRSMQIEMQHEDGTRVPGVANPLKMSKTPPRYRRPAPLLGEHTDEFRK